MGRYCLLQCKRIARFLPGVLLALLVLLGGLLSIFSIATRQNGQSEEDKKIPIAMVGSTQDTLMQMGLAALKAFDSTQFSMEIIQMSEDQARRALEVGDIGAYVVVPDNFVDEAMYGNILPLKFVSTVGAASVVSVFKEEVTDVVTLLLLESQRGVFGMQSAMDAEDLSDQGKHMEILSIEYVEYILVRDRMYQVEELGISDALGLEDYLLCGLMVLFLMMACLPFAPLMIRRDLALDRMIASRGRSSLGQALCDLLVYCGAMVAVTLPVILIARFLAPTLVKQMQLLPALPVVLLVCSLSFLLYTLSSDLIGGVLMQFFVSVALCFVSGCMYPVHFFPVEIQKLAQWLPTGAARSQLASCLSGSASALPTVLGYTLIFAVGAVTVRLHRIKEARV